MSKDKKTILDSKELKSRGYSADQIQKLENIFTEIIDKHNEKTDNYHKNEDWQAALEHFIDSYLTINEMLDFATGNVKFQIARSIAQPILEDIMAFAAQFLITQMLSAQNKKEVEELKKMVGE